MNELDPAVILTEDQLDAVFSGSQPEQIAMRNLIKTMFSLTAGTGGDNTEALWSGVVSGMGVGYVDNLEFVVAAGTYRINGTLYSSQQQTVVLDAADGSNPRIDTIYVNIFGSVGVITGTAAANPSQPTVDPTTQLLLTSVLVPTGATTLTGITSTNIYLENTEWTSSTSGTGFNANSTTNPYAGSKSIDGTAVAANATCKLTAASPISFDGEGSLTFRISSKAQWNPNRWLTFQFLLSSVAKGQPVSLTRTSYGFNSSTVGSYQFISIPKTHFSIPAGTLIDALLIRDAGGSIGFNIDNIVLQNTDPAIAVKENPLESFVISCSDETTALIAGTGKITWRQPYTLTVTSVSCSLTAAQASGSIFTVDVNESGTSILSTKLTIDNTEKTSSTAATPPVISDPTLAADSEMSIDIDQIGNGSAKGLKVILVGRRIG